MSQEAVVIGAGIGGLLAAAALSRAAPETEILLLDRDALPDGPENRRGVPQGRHAHLLMAGGWSAMETLFEGGMRERLLDAGAREISLGSGMLALTADAGWFHRYRWNGSRVSGGALAGMRNFGSSALSEATTRSSTISPARMPLAERSGRR